MEPVDLIPTHPPLVRPLLSLALRSGLWFCLLAGSLVGCTSFSEVFSDQRVAPTTTTPTAAPQTTRTTNQPSQQTSTRNRTQTGTRTSRYQPGQTFTCQTKGYFAQITWQGAQPYLQFGRSPTDISSTTTAVEDRAEDGSVTYTSRSDQTIIVRFLTNGGCNIRVFDQNGNVRINEAGRVVENGGNNSGNTGGNNNGNNNTANNQGYWDGWNSGFAKGKRDGRRARLYNYGDNPNYFFQSGSQTGNADYDAGFQDGFFRGFDEGYNDPLINPPVNPQPLPEPLPDPWYPEPGVPGSW